MTRIFNWVASLGTNRLVLMSLLAWMALWAETIALPL